MTLFTPPHYIAGHAPIIFLAGPIQGTTDWQKEAIAYITEFNPDIDIASPRRDIQFKKDFTNELYNEQVDWETFHLRLAGKHGVVLFWLAKECTHSCERAYAQTTRFELAEWKMHHEKDGAKLVIGIDEGFTGARYIRRRLNQDCPNIPLCSTLKETCEKAVEILGLLK